MGSNPIEQCEIDLNKTGDNIKSLLDVFAMQRVAADLISEGQSLKTVGQMIHVLVEHHKSSVDAREPD